MEENKKVVILGVIFICLVILAFVIYFVFIKDKGAEGSPDISSQVDVTESAEKMEEDLGDVEMISVPLDKSDEVVRDLINDLSINPVFKEWISSPDIMRKLTAAIVNIANGESPRIHIDFFDPEEKFDVVYKSGFAYINPDSYRRYDLAADVFVSLDTQECIQLFNRLRPIFQEALAELGYPDNDFKDILFQAIIELLEVPIIQEDIEVRKKIITYEIVDSSLENLTPSQKHLLRMGPENIEIIQGKLEDIALELGIPEERLPG